MQLCGVVEVPEDFPVLDAEPGYDGVWAPRQNYSERIQILLTGQQYYKKLFTTDWSTRGTWGSLNTAKKINEHRITAKNRRNTVTATNIFSYTILTSTLNVILLHLNNFPQNKHTIAELVLISASGALFAVVLQLHKPKPNPA